jgi:hypothetical protein
MSEQEQGKMNKKWMPLVIGLILSLLVLTLPFGFGNSTPQSPCVTATIASCETTLVQQSAATPGSITIPINTDHASQNITFPQAFPFAPKYASIKWSTLNLGTGSFATIASSFMASANARAWISNACGHYRDFQSCTTR